ncbi:S8 family serine peptidase [Sporohalobacter salinus]|uniref:S8 family serine peptidase n=1 Tax=Sporohalobacter salinus TaxID=1494606 RepID=UPI0019605DF8|nr:S8 family serine peptidase [Sporohalobacter salinus]MBM7623265.1 subtilisin family serine protease [Sporohalobacter salinus]
MVEKVILIRRGDNIFNKKRIKLFLIPLLIIICALTGCLYNQYNLRITTVGQGKVFKDPNKLNYEKYDRVKLTAEPKAGWKFNCWKGSLEGSANPKNIIINDDLEIKAVFQGGKHPLNIKVTGKGRVTKEKISTINSSSDYKHGVKIKLTAIPDENWEFKHWQGDLTGKKNPNTIMIDEEKTVKAVFTKSKYLLHAITFGKGQIKQTILSPTSQGVTHRPYEPGTKVRLTAVPNEGWVFDHWELDLLGSKNPATVTMNKEKVVTAVFSKLKYPLGINTIGRGSVKKELISEMSSRDYKYGSKVKLTAMADSGWKFDHWKNDILGTKNPATIIIDEPKKVTAVFTKTTTLKGKVKVNNKTKNNWVKRMEATQTIKNRMLPLKPKQLSSQYKKSEVIIKYKNETSTRLMNKLKQKSNLKYLTELQSKNGKIVHYQIPENKTIKEVIQYCKQLPQVEWIEPNYIYHATAIPSDKYYHKQWGNVHSNLEAAWDIQQGLRSVKVAVIDSGIIPKHPDLKQNLLSGYDFVDNDNNPTDETSRKNHGSHGTHVAGIIGAVSNNKLGIAGVNWKLKILPVRVLATNSGSVIDVAKGIEYAIKKNVDIINLSLGGPASRVMKSAIDKAVRAGITVVAAAGNQSSSVIYPAAYRNTIAVGAIGKDNLLASYSNYGPQIDVVAPGGDDKNFILSTWGYYENRQTYSNYAGMQGTSMAAPYVSGVTALLVADGINSPQSIRERLQNTAVDLGFQGKDNKYGYGLVDAYGALLNKKLGNIPIGIFAATKNGNTLKLRSKIKRIKDDNNYILDGVKPGNLYLIGWRDINENNIIDAGDYYGENGPLKINEGSTRNIDLEIYYFDSTTNFEIER